MLQNVRLIMVLKLVEWWIELLIKKLSVMLNLRISWLFLLSVKSRTNYRTWEGCSVQILFLFYMRPKNKFEFDFEFLLNWSHSKNIIVVIVIVIVIVIVVVVIVIVVVIVVVVVFVFVVIVIIILVILYFKSLLSFTLSWVGLCLCQG